jgi:aminoglycoside phosphotransferase (APT) family kinase protein
VEPVEGVIHGDAHPGNAIIRQRTATQEAILLDWGRARIGSPLEDEKQAAHQRVAGRPQARPFKTTMRYR